jgi:hypothetical protein
MFTLDEAVSLESLSGGVTLLPLAAAVSRAFPTITLDASRSDDVRHGRAIPIASAAGQTGVLGALDEDGDVLALVEARADSLRVVAGFSG